MLVFLGEGLYLLVFLVHFSVLAKHWILLECVKNVGV